MSRQSEGICSDIVTSLRLRKSPLYMIFLNDCRLFHSITEYKLVHQP